MKNIRFKDDEKLSEIYEKVNLAPFRNYVYDFDGLGTYCNYLDEYECAIDDRDDKIEKYKETIDKANKKLNNFIECCKAEKLESGSDYLHHQYWDMFERFNKQIKDILKEVE